jgi:serine/threonine protein kinase
VAKLPYRLDGKPHRRGGYATVTRGEDRETGQIAAIKQPHGDSESLARFQQETEVQRSLDHPNIMPVIRASEDGLPPWLAMPWADRNLTEAIERDRNVSSFQLLGVVAGAARGLEHAHRQSLIHRDVNPNNVMELCQGSSTRWVVGDWGLVGRPHRPSSPRMTSRTLGTEGFIAPEVLQDPLIVDPKSDVYSLGRIAHFAVSGVWPRYTFPLPNIDGSLWGDFVGRACREDRNERPTMTQLIAMVGTLESRVRAMEITAEDLACPRCGTAITGARCEQCGKMWD